jgi:CheY-like chemotaxis protein
MARRITVLVVDDEQGIREVAEAILSLAGYRVLTAANGHEAIQIIAAETIDLLFTDIRMPGMDGFDLASQAKVSQPNLRVLYSTGFAGKSCGDAPIGRTLCKPWRAHELVAEVGDALAAADVGINTRLPLTSECI